MMEDVISDTFQPVRSSLDDTQSGYHDFVLLRETASARLYRVSKSGKHFIIKTPIDNSAMRLSMLKREYEMAISLNHHHLPHFFTYESHTPVGPGIVMEYIDGRNLNEYLAENPSLDSRRRVFYQLLDAVAYIHKNGIIHNDLKPENILISRANNDVKLIDFGLSDNDAHYLAKTLGCTPDYASPELLAQSDDIDARSDIYSLGRIMQRIFGHKFSRISHRCTSHDRNRRYDNVDQIRRKFYTISTPIYKTAITLIIVIIVIPALFYAYNSYTSYCQEQEQAERLVINSTKIKEAFMRKQDRFTFYQIVPQNLSITTLKSMTRLTEEEILDVIEKYPQFRLINLASTRPLEEKPEDRFAVETYPLNRPYGYCIDRGSNITIVSTSGYNEPSISNFSFYLAMIGGFNYISREIGSITDGSFYNITQRSTDPNLQLFLKDIETLSNRDNSWIISLLSSGGNNEPKYPTQIHFTIGGKRGDESYNGKDLFVKNIARYDSIYQELSTRLESEYQLLSDHQRFHNSSRPSVFIRHLKNRDRINAIVMRLSWDVICWSSQRISIARTIAEVLSRHLDPDSFNPENPELYVKDYSFDGYSL